MTTATVITVTRALTELKRFDSRIEREIVNGVFSGVSKGTGANETVQGSTLKTVKEVEAKIEASFQSVQKLIANREAIKSAIVKSNAETFITFRGAQITVADAIELKGNVSSREKLLTYARHGLTQSKNTVQTGNVRVDEDADKIVTAAAGGDKNKLDTATQKSLYDSQYAIKRLNVVGAEITERKIAELEKEVEDIKTELDFLLSESNATTTVSVTL